jgi:ribA/ribD-fused uncharacterized protein
MPNKSAFLAVRLDAATTETLNTAAEALQSHAAELLSMPEGTAFDRLDTASLHMTFLFFGEYLRALPATELEHIYKGICKLVADFIEHPERIDAPLTFQCFDLFPPGKQNLVVARFQASAPLLDLRSKILELCREAGVSLPSSFFSLIEGEGSWNPHVTLGKIRASRQEVGQASCNGSRLQALSPRLPAQPMGLTLLGEHPPRVSCDWDGGLTFRPDEDTPVPPVELRRALSDAYGLGASKYDEHLLKEWEEAATSATGILNACKKEAPGPDRDRQLQAAAELFRTAAALRPDFVRAYVGCSQAFLKCGQWAQARDMLLQGLAQCPDDKVLARELVKLDLDAERSQLVPEHAENSTEMLQPLPGPGAELRPDDLSSRWSKLTWKHHVIAFKGSEERQNATPLRCFSNFYDEETFIFELPAGICAPGMHIADQDHFIRCDFSEKAIMLCKAAAMGDALSYKQIVVAQTPQEAKKLGETVADFDVALWDSVVCSVAYEVVRQKFTKVPALQTVLLETGDSLIAEATRGDKVWGIGIDKGRPETLQPSQWRGSNVLGWALMEVRREIRI